MYFFRIVLFPFTMLMSAFAETILWTYVKEREDASDGETRHFKREAQYLPVVMNVTRSMMGPAGSSSLKCEEYVGSAFGSPTPSIDWERNGEKLRNNSQVIDKQNLLMVSIKNHNGHNFVESKLSICNRTSTGECGEQFKFTATNDLGNTSSVISVGIPVSDQGLSGWIIAGIVAAIVGYYRSRVIDFFSSLLRRLVDRLCRKQQPSNSSGKPDQSQPE